MPKKESNSFLLCFERIYDIVREIPSGKVMTYGQIAGMTPGVNAMAVPAIVVGRAMAASGRYAPEIPWWRVIGREGNYGVLRKLQLSLLQRNMLRDESVITDAEGRYDLSHYQYFPLG